MAGAPAGPSRKELYPIEWHQVLSFLEPRDVMAMRVAFVTRARLLDADAKATPDELSDRSRRLQFSQHQQTIQNLHLGGDFVFSDMIAQTLSSILLAHFSKNQAAFLALSEGQKQMFYRAIKTFVPKFLDKKKCFKYPGCLLVVNIPMLIHLAITTVLLFVLKEPAILLPLSIFFMPWIGTDLYAFIKRWRFDPTFRAQAMRVNYLSRLQPESAVYQQQRSIFKLNRSFYLLAPFSGIQNLRYKCILNRALPYEVPAAETVPLLSFSQFADAFSIFRNVRLSRDDIDGIGRHLLYSNLSNREVHAVLQLLGATRYDAKNEFARAVESAIIGLPKSYFFSSVYQKSILITALSTFLLVLSGSSLHDDLVSGNNCSVSIFGLVSSLALTLASGYILKNKFKFFKESDFFHSLH